MANDYFAPTELSRHTLARAEQVNQSFTAVEAGFDKLPTPEAIKQGRVTYLVDSGVVNAYVVAFSPALSSYTAGTRVLMNTANANTGSATLNAGAGAVSIKRFDGSALQAGDIPNGIADLVYTGSEWRLINTHNAAASVTAAATSATAAASSASAASTSETNAATSETNAAASYDAFDDRYLGSKASDPALDNDGDALLTGALYWNTTSSVLKVYDGTTWVTHEKNHIIARMTLSTNESQTDSNIGILGFDTADFDQSSVATPASSKFTVPVGYTKARATASVVFAADSAGTRLIQIYAESTRIAEDSRAAFSASANLALSCDSGWVSVTAGDDIIVLAGVTSTTSGTLNVLATAAEVPTFFSVEFQR